MAKEIKIWYDKESDYSEVIFERKAGYFRETANDAVMEKPCCCMIIGSLYVPGNLLAMG